MGLVGYVTSSLAVPDGYNDNSQVVVPILVVSSCNFVLQKLKIGIFELVVCCGSMV